MAGWIRETEDRRKAAELRLRKLTTGEGMTAAEIRDLVERMHGIVAILASASTEDRRRVYEAAQLSITYDHLAKRAKLHASPNPEVWSSVRVGGASSTQRARAPCCVSAIYTLGVESKNQRRRNPDPGMPDRAMASIASCLSYGTSWCSISWWRSASRTVE